MTMEAPRRCAFTGILCGRARQDIRRAPTRSSSGSIRRGTAPAPVTESGLTRSSGRRAEALRMNERGWGKVRNVNSHAEAEEAAPVRRARHPPGWRCSTASDRRAAAIVALAAGAPNRKAVAKHLAVRSRRPRPPRPAPRDALRASHRAAGEARAWPTRSRQWEDGWAASRLMSRGSRPSVIPESEIRSSMRRLPTTP